MSLDMYLNKRMYIGAIYEFNKISGTLALTKNNVPININLNKVMYILEEQARWSNAIPIHNWFVNNVQDGYDDCKYYIVEGDKLLELVDLCKKVLKNHSLAKELLPTDEWLSYTYNDSYFRILEETVEQLKDVDADFTYEYTSSW